MCSFRISDADEQKARRIAFLACNEGFEYWLDVLDPNLQGLPPKSRQGAAAIATIIEVALLNSTHVIAVITTNTRNSQWVPYEYGRVKVPQLTSTQAACWTDRALSSATLPEYLHLGAILDSEQEVRHWLRNQVLQYPSYGRRPCIWHDPTPPPL